MDNLLPFTIEEQNRMKAEEIFRWEVRRKLDQSSDKGRKSITALLSTPLGLFLLSSVLLPVLIWLHGLVSQAIQVERQRNDAREARVARVERLDTEISYRYSKAMMYLQQGLLAVPQSEKAQITLEKAMHQMTANPRVEEVHVLYDDFDRSSGYALLSELRDHLVSAGIKSELITQSGTVRSVILKLSKLETDVQLQKVELKEAIQVLKATMNLPPVEQCQEVDVSRWHKGFARTDCSSKEVTC
ncbi:hypothetical protein [Pseudoduganella lutea]|uniref:Uncharacterized protein n=1 Tax=Pseudoduganella lutea TaxID=321985 RepID=A0A4P6L2Y8_9BURK|nr:hypothetical protein [Pseudoduganella lutea]QBE65996.1 hypothetical protein EWM63_25905 [Pseudoduganella lutea]